MLFSIQWCEMVPFNSVSSLCVGTNIHQYIHILSIFCCYQNSKIIKVEQALVQILSKKLCIYILFHHFFIADLLPFYCIRFLIIGWNGIILLQRVCKMVESTMLYRTYTCSCAWDLSCRRCIPRRERDVSGVSSTMYLWKKICLNIWCNLEFWTIWKCIHTMNLNNIKYLAIWLFVNPVQIWIMYEFEFKFKFELEIFNCSLNLYIWLFGSRHYGCFFDIGWHLSTDTKDSLTHPEQRFFRIGCIMTADTRWSR
jgi:hypothetical protein